MWDSKYKICGFEVDITCYNPGLFQKYDAKIMLSGRQIEEMSNGDILEVLRTFQGHCDEIAALELARECNWSEQFLNGERLWAIFSGTIATDEEKQMAKRMLMGEEPDIERVKTSQPVESKEHKKKPGFVYLLWADNGTYKIGMSNNADRRTQELGVLLPYELELVHTIETDDMITLEKELHERFDHCRLRGEWFDLNDSDVEYIKGL